MSRASRFRLPFFKGGRLLALLIGLAIASAVIWVSRPDAMWEGIREVDPGPLLVALLLNVPVVLLRAVRTQVVLRFLGHKVSFRSMVPVQLVGQTSSTLTPAASGDYLRAYIWRRTQGIPIRVGAAVVTFERIYSLGLLVAVAALLISLPRYGIVGWVGVAVGLAAATLAPAAIELITPPAIEQWAIERITTGRLLSRFTDGALELANNLRQILRSSTLLVQTSAITLAVFILSGLQVMLLIAGLGDSVRITQAVAVYATSQVAGILSTLPFGLGAADAILVTVLAGYGVNLADSAVTAVLFRAVSTLPQALAGLVAYVRLHGLPEPEAEPEPMAAHAGSEVD
jgi:uncharacterized protein (TIRG00374 family)